MTLALIATGCALAWCALVLFAHIALGDATCTFSDTADCAESHVKNGTYQGVLVDVQGQPQPDTPFTVAFEQSHAVGGFSSDQAGRYCVVWAEDHEPPSATFADGETQMNDWQSLNGPSPPPGCQRGDRGIQWNHADDLKSSPQYISVFALLASTIAVLLAGLLLIREPLATRVRAAGLLLTAASTASAALLWLTTT